MSSRRRRWLSRFIDDLWRDLTLAVRSLRTTPVATTVAMVSLALAMGANTAIFSILNGLVLRDLPVREPARLALVTDGGAMPRVRAWSHPFWDEIRQRTTVFDGAAAWSITRFNAAPGGESAFVEGLWASGSYFEALGVPALLGRTFSPADDQPDGGPDGPVAVISHGCWQRQFGGASDVIGQTIRLNTVPFTVIGVTPAEFFGTEVGRAFDVAVPLSTEALLRGRDSALGSSATNWLTVAVRLQPGQSIDAAAAQLQAAQPAIRAATIGPWDKSVADRYMATPLGLVPGATGYSNLRRSYQQPLTIVAIIVALVLVIGCVNVANLLLARATARRHELSVRCALGGTRWRLARQLFTESVVLASGGAALGLFVATDVSAFLVRQLSTSANLVFLDVSIDHRVLTFTAAATILTALLFGTAPAFQAARISPIDALKEQGRASGAQGGRGIMRWLVVLQVALSVMLVVAAGLFVKSFASLASRPLGFEAAPVLIVNVDPDQTGVDPSRRVALYERVLTAVLKLPDVADAALSHRTPIGGGGFTPPVEVSRGASLGTQAAAADQDVFGNLISPRWFSTFGTRMALGRGFSDDDRPGAPRVAIVNEAFAHRFFGVSNPLGETITVYPGTPRALSMQVVGVAADAVYSSPREPVPPTWYAPIAQFDIPGFPFSPARLSVRARAVAPEMLTKSVAAAIATVEPRLALTFRPLADQIHASVMQERLMSQLAAFFGLLALLLAALGLYGVTAQAISRRRTEVGIRIALGASPAAVIRLVMTQVWVEVGLGIAAGTGLSLWAASFVGTLLYDVAPRDPSALMLAVCALSATAACAGWLPARRASRLDPVAVLRDC
jgi:putative ABC transport system permease protein